MCEQDREVVRSSDGEMAAAPCETTSPPGHLATSPPSEGASGKLIQFPGERRFSGFPKAGSFDGGSAA